MDSHIRKYKQIRNKYNERIIKQKISEQRKIERVQQKVLADLDMDKEQFSNRFGWRNTLSKSIDQININA